MRERKTIREEDGAQKEWYTRARKMTMADLSEFIRELTEDYAHDYGTICHAVAAAGLAAMWAIEHSDVGGITGFQSGAVQWQIIREWDANGSGDNPLRLLDLGDMLYPQYGHKFHSITLDTWEWLQKRAKELLADRDALPADNVSKHWQRIAAGVVPFGYAVEA